jgi:hypothetical protein
MSASCFVEECPGLVSVLSRSFSQQEIQTLSRDYDVVIARGGNDEIALAREEGVSFSPRAARIVLLSFREAGATSFEQVRVALYSAAREELLRGVGEASSLERDLKRVRNPVKDDEAWVKGVALVSLLDEVRHLHMTTLPREKRLECLSRARSSALLDPNFGTPEGLRLRLEHSINLQERVLGADAE